MARVEPITDGAQIAAAVGAVTGTLDISGAPYARQAGEGLIGTLRLNVLGLAAGKRALIAIEDTALAAGDAFDDALPVAVAHVEGPIDGGGGNGLNFEWDAYRLPMMRRGGANNKLRCNVLACDAEPGLVLQAWMEL